MKTKNKHFNHSLQDLLDLDQWCKDVGLIHYNAVLENGRLAVIYKKNYFTKAKDLIKFVSVKG